MSDQSKMYTIQVTSLGVTESYPQCNLTDTEKLFEQILKKETAQLLEIMDSTEFEIHVESDHISGKACIIQKSGNVELFCVEFSEGELQ